MLSRYLRLFVPCVRSNIRFAAHLYQSRKEYRLASETAGNSGKRIERCVIATFQTAQSFGYHGELRQMGTPASGWRMTVRLAAQVVATP